MADPLKEQVLEAARGWLGTPYRHQASVKGAGCDCLGLLRGVWREVYGVEAEKPPAYRPEWFDMRKDELLLAKARQYLIPLKTLDEGIAGDALVFRMRRGSSAKHCAILAPGGYMIHALTGKDVEEVYMGPQYLDARVQAFRFPPKE